MERKIGFNFPTEIRKTALAEVENWYQKLLSQRLDRPYEEIKRSNFGEYAMAVNYLTSVLEEAKAIEKVAVFNIDHMAQIQFTGPDSMALLNRVLPCNVESMKIGQCKYTLLLTSKGTVLDDLIIMKLADDNFILVINAGHDLTDKEKGLVADADFIYSFIQADESVDVKDISDKLVKIDVQGPYSYRLLADLFGSQILKNPAKPTKNMKFFTFNQFVHETEQYYLSRTGYTNRWGWELYVPVNAAEKQFMRIAEKALELGGLVVGLGGRDENRISAGNFGLPLNGSEYNQKITPTNCPLFKAAIDMNKEDFVGKEAIEADIATGTTKRMVLFITEGIVLGRVIYLDGKKAGFVTSSINSPNVPLEKRKYIGSKRKNVNAEEGTAAIGLGWMDSNPFEVDSEGKDILEKDGEPVRINLEFFRVDADGNPKGKPVIGYISGNGTLSLIHI